MKVKVSFDGRHNNETWEIDEWNDMGEPAMVISRGDDKMKVYFENVIERIRYNKRVGLCRAEGTRASGEKKQIYLTSF